MIVTKLISSEEKRTNYLVLEQSERWRRAESKFSNWYNTHVLAPLTKKDLPKLGFASIKITEKFNWDSHQQALIATIVARLRRRPMPTSIHFQIHTNHETILKNGQPTHITMTVDKEPIVLNFTNYLTFENDVLRVLGRKLAGIKNPTKVTTVSLDPPAAPNLSAHYTYRYVRKLPRPELQRFFVLELKEGNKPLYGLMRNKYPIGKGVTIQLGTTVKIYLAGDIYGDKAPVFQEHDLTPYSRVRAVPVGKGSPQQGFVVAKTRNGYLVRFDPSRPVSIETEVRGKPRSFDLQEYRHHWISEGGLKIPEPNSVRLRKEREFWIKQGLLRDDQEVVVFYKNTSPVDPEKISPSDFSEVKPFTGTLVNKTGSGNLWSVKFPDEHEVQFIEERFLYPPDTELAVASKEVAVFYKGSEPVEPWKYSPEQITRFLGTLLGKSGGKWQIQFSDGVENIDEKFIYPADTTAKVVGVEPERRHYTVKHRDEDTGRVVKAKRASLVHTSTSYYVDVPSIFFTNNEQYDSFTQLQKATDDYACVALFWLGRGKAKWDGNIQKLVNYLHDHNETVYIYWVSGWRDEELVDEFRKLFRSRVFVFY